MSQSVLFMLALVGGGLAGALLPAMPVDPLYPLVIATAVQLVISVGGLPSSTRPTPVDVRHEVRRLAVWHYLIGTLPWIVAWFLLDGRLDADASAVLVGLTVLATMPVSAGLPAYATAARAASAGLTRLAVLAYLAAPVLTPALLVVTVGADAPLELALRLVVTLVLPTVLGLAARRWVRRVPAPARFVTVLVAMTVCSLMFGQSLGPGSAFDAPASLVVVAGAWGVVRVAVGAGLALLGSRRTPGLRAPLTFATVFKNEALAATVAFALAGPLAMVPCLTSMLVSMVVVVVVAATRRRDAVVPACAAPEPA